MMCRLWAVVGYFGLHQSLPWVCLGQAWASCLETLDHLDTQEE